MSTFYLKIAIEKKWWTQNFSFLSLKSSSPNQFWEPQLTRISLNFQSSWTTYESEVWDQNCVWLFYYFYFQRNYKPDMSRRLKKDVGFKTSWRCLIYAVLKTSNLRCLEDVWFTTSRGCLIYNVLKTSDLYRLEDSQFTTSTSWGPSIYDVFKTSDLRRLEDVQFTTYSRLL